MANVLVLDREREVGESIVSELLMDGHKVELAQDPGTALARACIYKPDVLITEWMLGGSFDGIDMSQLVEAVNPEAKTILLTGYASSDLRNQSIRSGIYEFLEKPLPLNLLRNVVKKALLDSQLRGGSIDDNRFVGIGIMSVADTDRIEFVNETLQSMIRGLHGSGEELQTSQLFSVYDLAVLENSVNEWVTVTPFESETKWYVRAREIPGSNRKLWVVLDEDHAYWRDSAAVARLLGFPEPQLQVDGHFLMIDDSEIFRTVTQRLLKGHNNICITANTHEEGIRLFVRDGSVKYVVLDYEMPDGKAEDIIAVIRQLRPNIPIVGTSGDPSNRNKFEAAGVKKFLKKPWTAAELYQAFGLDARAH